MLKFGLINLAGEFVLEPKYDVIYTSEDGGPTCVRVKREERPIRTPEDLVTGGWHYVWLDGSPAFEGEFDQAFYFSEGLARVKKGGVWCYIDWSGQTVIETDYDYVDVFSDGLALVRKDKRYGYINQSGNLVIPLELRYAERCSCSRACAVNQDRQCGYLDAFGQWAIPAQLKAANPFSGGLAFVTTERFYGLIDVLGQPVTPLTKPWNPGMFSEGLCHVLTDSVKKPEGYVNIKGELAIPPSFDSASPFHGGFAAVEVDNKWGLIDRSGHYALQPTYDLVEGFSSGVVAVKEKDVRRYVDVGGAPVFGKTFSSVGLFSNGLARVGIEVG